MIILIDNGHGINTPGKCSPDRRLLEWQWNRRAAALLKDKLCALGIDARLLVSEDTDIPLTSRVQRANAACAQFGAKNVLLISVHVNAAAADGKWHNASGFCPFVAPNASEASKRLAKLLTIEAGNAGLLGNRCVPLEKYWTGNFTIIAKTRCPAVLTENMFQDNRSDVDYLLTDAGVNELMDIHVRAIQKFLAQ